MSAIDTLTRALQINVAAVFLVVGIFKFPCCSIIAISFTDGALLAATKDLEGIAGIEVDGGGAPYLRLSTVATAKHVKCLTQHIHTLLVEQHA